MLRARNQADGYARAVAKEDGWPPLLLIVDVGHVIEIYADFSRQGQARESRSRGPEDIRQASEPV